MPKTKHNAGYYLKNSMDIVDLFIGQEGTLGVITEVGIILKEVSEDFLYLTIFLNNDNLALINDIKKSSLNVIAIEYFDYNSIRLLKDYRTLMKEASHVPIIPDETESALYVEIAFNKNEFNNVYYEINKILKKIKFQMNQHGQVFLKKPLRNESLPSRSSRKDKLISCLS
jgi:D-lactate dehydrogenase (cytochrome)